MNKIEIISGSLPDPNLESLSREVWMNKQQILQLGRYQGRWILTLGENASMEWEEFLGIVEDFKRFVSDEDVYIEQESKD